MIIFNREKYLRLSKFSADKNNIRFYLHSVYFEPHPEKGAIGVATDGHAILIAHDEHGKVESPQIRPALTNAEINILKSGKCPDACVQFGASSVRAIRALEDEDVELGITGWIPDGGPTDVKYPDWRKVLPETFGEAATSHTIDSQLLKRFWDAGFKKGAPLTFFPGKEIFDAVCIRFESPDYFAVVMPMRHSHPINNVIPGWLEAA